MTDIAMLTPHEADKIVQQEKGTFIDIRTVSEALAEQLPHSLFLPFDLISSERLQGLGVGDKTPILVCRSGSRAKQAADALVAGGGNAAVLEGGIDRWKKNGLPTTSGRKSIPLDRQVLVGAGSMVALFTLMGVLVSPVFFALTILMACGMVFAGVTGACGMARVLVMMPWNKAPLCGGSCKVPESSYG